jgi:repressor LexA
MKRPEPHLKLFKYIENYDREHGLRPVIDEMMIALNKSRSAIQNSLQYLETEGYISRERGKARTIKILNSAHDGIQIWGSIAAGYLTEAFIDNREVLPISSPKLRQGDFALKVTGDSMTGDHIQDGSYVVMRPCQDLESLKNGTIVAAWVEGFGTTLKHFHREDHLILLRASNHVYKEIIVDTKISAFTVQGVLKCIWKEWT